MYVCDQWVAASVRLDWEQSRAEAVPVACRPGAAPFVAGDEAGWSARCQWI